MAPDQCIAGQCRPPPSPAQVTDVRILSPAGVVRPGTTYRFVAVALDQSGQVVPGVPISWSSSQTSVATIDPTGLATGAMSAGTTEITASVNTGMMNVVSPPVALTNLGPIANGATRVTVVAASSGAPVSSAIVVVTSTAGDRTATTDASGTVSFSGIGPLTAVTVFNPAYDYLSVLGPLSNDVLVPLPSVTRSDQVGGLKGTVDLSMAGSMGQVGVSLSGGSFESPLYGLSVQSLFGGDVFQVPVPIPGQMLKVPVLASATIQVSFMGAPISLKDTYYARTRPGLRAAWSFGGYTGLSALGLGGGGGAGGFLGALLPYFQRFAHGTQPAISVLSLATVPDTGDINGNGNTTELVPDYAHFPSVALTPSVAQSLRYFLELGGAQLPLVKDGPSNALVVVSGAMVPGAGFVPLGLDGMQAAANTATVASFTTKIAPPHGGLEVGRYAVLAMAVRLAGGGTALPGPGSSRIYVGDSLPTTVDMSGGFLDAPQGGVFHAMGRGFDVPAAAPAGALVHVAFAAADGAWHVYFDAGAGSVTIPAPPTGTLDRTQTSSATVDAVRLAPGYAIDGLFSVAGAAAGSLDQAALSAAQADVAFR
jgi:hypothetical protein